jgi:hypothetical protein
MENNKNVIQVLNEIKNINNMIDIREILLKNFLYRINVRQIGCCCVKLYDCTNDLSEIKEFYNNIDKSKYEIYFYINFNNEWLEFPNKRDEKMINFIDDILDGKGLCYI